MKQFWSGRVASAAGRYGDHAPMAAVCCNACRACVTTNIIGLAVAGAGGALVFARRLLRFVPKPS
jgi:hypothetical protein